MYGRDGMRFANDRQLRPIKSRHPNLSDSQIRAALLYVPHEARSKLMNMSDEDRYNFLCDEHKLDVLLSLVASQDILTNAVTTDDLEDYVKSYWGVEIADLGGLDTEAMRDTFIQMLKVFLDFPVLVGRVEQIVQYYMYKDDLAWCELADHPSKTVITFNTFYYTDVISVETAYKNLEEDFNAPYGTSYTSVGVHELGHALSAYLTWVHHNDELEYATKHDWIDGVTASKIVDKALMSTELCAAADYVDSKLSSEATLFFENTRKRDIKMALFSSLSRYSLYVDKWKIDKEIIAEAFADWYTNYEKAHPLSMNIRRVFMETLSKPNSRIGRGVLPRFIAEHYQIHIENNPFDEIIGVKEDAPEWAKEEFKKWKKRRDGETDERI